MSYILNRNDNYRNSLGDFFGNLFKGKTQKANEANTIALQQEQIESTNLIQNAYTTEAGKTTEQNSNTLIIAGVVGIAIVGLTIFFTR